jgi:hypothetical protein
MESDGPNQIAEKSDCPKRFTGLLLADLEHFGESLWRNDEIGERRFNFFLTLTTSVIAGLAALYAADNKSAIDKAMLPYVTRAALAGLFMFGLMTYLRLLQKNRVTDEHHQTLRHIRERLAKLDPEALGYNVPQQLPHTVKWLRGGLAQTAALMTAGLSALLVYSFAASVALAVATGSVFAIGLVCAAIRKGAE